MSNPPNDPPTEHECTAIPRMYWRTADGLWYFAYLLWATDAFGNHVHRSVEDDAEAYKEAGITSWRIVCPECEKVIESGTHLATGTVQVELQAVRDPDGRPAVLMQLPPDTNWLVTTPAHARHLATLLDTIADRAEAGDI